MPKKMLIDASHAEETRVVVVDGNKVEEFDFESITKRQLAGNIYLAKVTRVEPSLQAAFVDYGGNRHGFLAYSEIHPDYYQIPVEDRQKLLDEEAALEKAQADEDEGEKPAPKRRRRSRSKAEDTGIPTDDVIASDPMDISGDEDPLGTSDDDDNSSLLVETPEDEAPKKRRVRKPRARKPKVDAETKEETTTGTTAGTTAEAPATSEAVNAPVETVSEAASETEEKPKPKPRSRTRTRRKKVVEDKPEIEGNPQSDPQSDEESSDDSNDSDSRSDDASNTDTEIEQIATDNVQEEVVRRKPRQRRYKIQEVIKVRQILLVQVVKEERGNKGAALTTYLSLAGRYCVLMPNTARGGGISRKITNPADRKKLKDIAGEIEVPQGAGLIVRTAGAKRTKTEIKRDYEYLLRLWEEIRELTLSSIAPKIIYEEGNLIKRSIRDLYNREIDEILVEGEHGYREAKEYMKMLLPSHAKNVKLYNDPLRLFARHQVENYLAGMMNPTVQLRSGGYIVIGITEALVAIDVNSGRATKEGSIEETAVKTNLEASEEIARQMRLRDLAGLIVIDFIDMEERRNNIAVEKRLKDSLKNDRARIQIGRISGFGLLEMSRQRLRPGMLEATTSQCPHCYGTGYVRSNESLALAILRELEEEAARGRHREVLVKVSINVANYMLNQKREHVAEIETKHGMSVRVEADAALIGSDYTLERLKHATRIIPQVTAKTNAVTVDRHLPVDIEEEVEAPEAPASQNDPSQNTASSPVETEEETQKKPRKRRRRRRGRGGNDNHNVENATEAQTTEAGSENADVAGEEAKAALDDTKSSTPTEGNAQTVEPIEAAAADVAITDSVSETVEAIEPVVEEKPRKRVRRPRKPKAVVETATETAASDAGTADVTTEVAPSDAAPSDAAPSDSAPEPAEKPKRKRAPRRKKVVEPVVEAVAEAPEPAKVAETVTTPVVAETAAPEPVAEVEPVVTVAETVAEAPEKPARKRAGWWSRAIGRS